MSGNHGPSVQRWLDELCTRTSALSGGVVIEADDQDGSRIVAQWPAQTPVSQTLFNTAVVALSKKVTGILVPPIVQGLDGPQRIVTLVFGATTPNRVLALGVTSQNDDICKSILADLQGQREALNRMDDGAASIDSGMARKLLGLQSTLLLGKNLTTAAMAFVNELCVTLGFDRASLGLLEDGRIRLLALSHNAEFQSRQELLVSLACAMDEAADQGVTLTQPPRPEDRPHILLAHAEFAQRAGTHVCSLPIAHAGRLTGILTVERAGTQPSRDDIAQCEHLVALMAPIIDLRRRAEQSFQQRLFDTVRNHRSRLGSPEARWLRVAAVLVTGALALASFVPLSYSVNSEAHIEGLEQRLLVAPVDGFLRESHVRPGDTVKAGQLLAEMADQDLVLEERRWQADLSQHENAYIGAMARSDRGAFAISRAKANEAFAQLELVRSQLERMRIVAPIDGIIVQGDLSQSLGAPVRRGDTLLTISPRGRHRLRLEVDERDIGDVLPGAPGKLVLAARPGDAMDFVVERVIPVAVTRDGANRFEIEARLVGDARALRPGMQGVGKITASPRPLLWQMGHRVSDWLRLRLFAWGL